MEYKGYKAKVEFDDSVDVFHGQVIGLKDVITFEGITVEELYQSFKDSVDDYLEFCEELGQEPEKEFSGKFIIRIPPDLHRELCTNAKIENKSLNQYVEEILAVCSGYDAHVHNRVSTSLVLHRRRSQALKELLGEEELERKAQILGDFFERYLRNIKPEKRVEYYMKALSECEKELDVINFQRILEDFEEKETV